MNTQKLARSSTLINLVSFVIVSVCGILINLLVARNFEITSVGLFTYYYSLVIVFSQFNTLGLHYSALKFLAEDDDGAHEKLTSGLVACFISGLIFVFIFLNYAYFWSELPKTMNYMTISTLGLFIFSLNKYFLFCLNGLHKLTEFAIFNALRYVISISWIATGVYVLSFSDADLFLCSVILIPEVLLLIMLCIRLKSYIQFSSVSASCMKQLYFFGSKGMWTGALGEINTKVDVLLITHFLGPGAAGIYAIPAMIFEGAGQLPAVFRNILNPKISRFYRQKKWDDLRAVMAESSKYSLTLVPVLGVISAFLFPVYVKFFIGIDEYLLGWPSVLVLLLGLTAASAWLPLQMFLIQIGSPAKQSLFLFGSVVLNVVLNILLIPPYGILGAATATAVTTFTSSALNRVIVSREMEASSRKCELGRDLL